ncbi:MAG TPA: gephyrin-like molybdotransferase Glp [Streptosporangiaceae bacterium]|nr:gephyrin-like molybdotransferase Glp [Streptosporangiaceae bacterium]
MDPVEAHVARVLAAIRPIEPARLGLAEAQGAVLATDAVATCPLPSFDNSSMDGYAVHASDIAAATTEAPVTLPVADQIPAGDTRVVTVAPGSCTRIMTGALFPAGADAVVPVEWTDGGTAQARFSRPVAKGYSIRWIGDDVAEGAVLLPQGTRLGPAQLALLAATGHGSVLARGAPRVAVIATGNELSEPGSPLVPGRIWESNTYMLAAAVRQAGGVATRYRAGDDPQTVLALLDELSAEADLLVTSGGVSMGGEHDVVKAALSRSDAADMSFGKVAMQPGMPQGFGVVGRARTPILTLPGNPVSAFVSFCLFVRPALDALQGMAPRPLPSRRAELTGRVSSPAGRRSFLRGVLAPDGTTVTPLTGQGSHQLGALAQANALIVVPEPVTALEAGDAADVISLP